MLEHERKIASKILKHKKVIAAGAGAAAIASILSGENSILKFEVTNKAQAAELNNGTQTQSQGAKPAESNPNLRHRLFLPVNIKGLAVETSTATPAPTSTKTATPTTAKTPEASPTVTPTARPDTPTPTKTPEAQKDEFDLVLAEIQEKYGVKFVTTSGLPIKDILTLDIAKTFNNSFALFPNLKGVIQAGLFRAEISVRLVNSNNIFTGWYGEIGDKGTLSFDIPQGYNLDSAFPVGQEQNQYFKSPFKTNREWFDYMVIRELAPIFVNKRSWGYGINNPLYAYAAPLLDLKWDTIEFLSNNVSLNSNGKPYVKKWLLNDTEATLGVYDGKEINLQYPWNTRVDHAIGTGYAHYRRAKLGRFDMNSLPTEQRLSPEIIEFYKLIDFQLERAPKELLGSPLESVDDLLRRLNNGINSTKLSNHSSGKQAHNPAFSRENVIDSKINKSYAYTVKKPSYRQGKSA